MKLISNVILAFFIGLLIVLESCKCEGPDDNQNTQFSGKVTTIQGSPIAKAKVMINDRESLTNEDGVFTLEVHANDEYLVNIEKFGFGLYSRSFGYSFSNKTITLTQGTVIEFDPSVDNVLTDDNAGNNIMQSALTRFDTSKLFNVTPRVYDHTGKLIDLGWPDGLEDILDYVKEPITRRPGMRLNLRANSLRSISGNNPPSGSKLQAALTTVDFFNPDGMPGDFMVRYQGDPRQFDKIQRKIDSAMNQENPMSVTNKIKDSSQATEVSDFDEDTDPSESRFAYMESFGAATIEITDGEESYNLKEGETATVTIPIYEIRKLRNEVPPPSIPLLHYDENDAIWEVTGIGYLNETGDAYVGEVKHFSTVNFDLVKTGDSKCFKIRQMLINGVNDNSGGAEASYRAHVIIPESATSTFSERNREIIESTGCSPVDGTGLHAVTRIPVDVPYVVSVFSRSGSGNTDTLDIVVSSIPPSSTEASTIIGEANNCTSCDNSTLDCSQATDMADPAASDCNTTCWLSDCGIIPFDNSGATISEIVGVPMGGGQVKVKWVSTLTTTIAVSATAHATSCSTAPLMDLASCFGCIGNSCRGGEYIYSGTPGDTVYFKVLLSVDPACDPLSSSEICSGPVVIL